MNSFNQFGLAQPLLLALADEGHTSPTPIQTEAIPAVRSGRDLIGIAQTGTGKTAAFALPILDRLITAPPGQRHRRPRALVLSPTRELALQIRDRFQAYGRGTSLRIAAAVGGVGITPQIKAIASGVDVLIATPGRLQDLIGSGSVDLSHIEVFVLDEADRMLDMGFIGPIRQIAARLPERRQTLFFSATMPKAIAELCKTFLHDPISVAAAPSVASAERIDQSVIFVQPGEKMRALEQLLRSGTERTLVFARTKRGADRLVRGLVKAGVGAKAIHGGKSQSQRVGALEGFRKGQDAGPSCDRHCGAGHRCRQHRAGHQLQFAG